MQLLYAFKPVIEKHINYAGGLLAPLTDKKNTAAKLIATNLHV